MILVTLSVFAPPGRRDEMIDLFWLLLGPVRVEPGCLSCALYEAVGQDDAIVYVEEWETAGQLERHMRSDRYDVLLAAMESSARPPALQYHTISGSKGLEYLRAVRLGAAANPPSARDAASADS